MCTVSPEGSVEATPSDLSSERGVSQTFTCSSRGGPGNTFTWTRLLDRVVLTTNSTLRVLVDSAEAGGYYRCTVQNDAGNETDDVVLRGMHVWAQYTHWSVCVCVCVCVCVYEHYECCHMKSHLPLNHVIVKILFCWELQCICYSIPSERVCFIPLL